MLKSIPLAFAAALLLGQAANAAISASATTDLNVRSGPGTDYPVVGVLAANAAATITGDCMQDSMWCMIDADGLQGWAFSAYLTGADGSPVVAGGTTVTFGSTGPLLLNPSPSDATASSGSGNRYNVFPSESDPNYGTDTASGPQP